MRTDTEVKSGEVHVHIATASKSNNTDRLDIYFTPQELTSFLKTHLPNIFAKSQKWDELEAKIAKFYENEEGDFDEEKPEQEGDLCDIGELAAEAFGWL
jgi:hypothetical protein